MFLLLELFVNNNIVSGNILDMLFVNKWTVTVELNRFIIIVELKENYFKDLALFNYQTAYKIDT